MKRIISFCLAFTIIMSSLNFEAVQALSNKINEFTSVYSALSQSETEEMNGVEDKGLESEEISNFAVKESQFEEINDSEQEAEDYEERINSESNEVDSEEINGSDEKEAEIEETTIFKEGEISSYSNATNSVGFYDTSNKYYPMGSVKEAIDKLKELNKLYDDSIIEFRKNYTITPEDANAMKVDFKNTRLIFKAVDNVTVTVPKGINFEMYGDSTKPNSRKYITFENIRFEFQGSNSIYANGGNLHMGKGITMEGSNYPSIFAGSNSRGSETNGYTRIFIESGRYENILTSSSQNSRKIKGTLEVEFYGGYSKKITSPRDNGRLMTVAINLYGGEIGEVIDETNSVNGNEGRIDLNIKNNTVNIGEVKSAAFINISKNSKLIVRNSIKLNGNLNIHGTFEKGENGNIDARDITIGEGATIRLPADRDKDNVPLRLKEDTYTPSKFKLELSTNPTKEEFYLIEGKKGIFDKYKDNSVISEDEEFYMDIESGADKDYFKAKVKEKGPLIYDVGSNKFFINKNGNEKEAWWINNKIDLSTKILEYDDLAKHEYYYVLSPKDITLQIRGNGDGKTLKFNNNRHNDRRFIIEFSNLNVSNSEFSFENIAAVNIDGVNAIKEDNNKVSLTLKDYRGISFTDKNSSLTLYRKYNDGNKYTVGNGINYNGGSLGNASMINMSIEERPNSDRNLQLYSTSHNGTMREFPRIITGYDEMTVLLDGDEKEYVLYNGDKTTLEDIYYYQSTIANNGNVNQNSGQVGTKFTLIPNSTKNYYNVNNKQRVHVVASKENQNLYYLENTLEDAMNNHVNLTDATHEVVFLGDYKIEDNDDYDAIKNHSGDTSGITFKTKVDDWKYTLNVNDNIELATHDSTRTYHVTFDKIKFNYKSPDKWIYGNGRTLTFGTDVEMEGQNYPSVSGGQSTSGNSTVPNTNVTINSGTYKDVTGNLYNTVQNSARLTINNGIFNGEVSGISGGTAGTITLTINEGTFASKVSGAKARSDLNSDLNMTIYSGIFNDVVVGIDGGTVSNFIFTINDGTFNQKVYGINSESSLSGDLNFTINNGTFNQGVLGSSANTTREKFNLKDIFKGKASRGNTKIIGALNMKINNGVFEGQVNAAEALDGGKVNFEIVNGIFQHNIGGISVGVNNVELTMTIKGGEYNGLDTFGQYSLEHLNNTIILNIEGGVFNNLVYGSRNTANTTINVSGGTFNSNAKLEGSNFQKNNNNNTVINIKGNIVIPRVNNYDKLVVGDGVNPFVLAITDKIDEGHESFNSELVIKNGSEVKLQGNEQSSVDRLTIEGDGNTLTLAMDRDTSPLVVKEEYNANRQKLTLKSSGQKSDNKELIEFLGTKADANNFNFINEDYYIREIENTSANVSGNKIKVYEKMSPRNLRFKLDIDGNTLEYSENGGPMQDVWWYDPTLLEQDIVFLEEDMFKYKGMGLFKDMNNIASGDKVFEITNESSDKNISINLGQVTNFDLKLNNSKLTNSTVDASNIQNLILEGENSISELSGTKEPFSINMSGEVKSSNDQSYLNIFTKQSNVPFSSSLVNGRRDIAQVIDFKFYEEFNKDEEVRLVSNNGGNELSFTIPNETGRLVVVFGKSNTNKTYNLYHGNGNSGTSVYVSGNTDATFKESFDTSSNNALQTYDYVRRAKPFSSIQVDVTKNLNFSVDTQSSGLNGINQDNWKQYFNATDMEVQNNSVAYKDVFIDEKGVTHNFGKINTDLEFGYLGVSPSNTITNGIELVTKNQLDPNITSAINGVKLALKFNDGQNEIPLDENAVIATSPLEKWTVSSLSKKSLDIVPDFTDYGIFFNVSNNLPNTTNSSHNFTFRFGLVTP